MLRLPKERFQVLAGHILIGKEEVKSLIWPPGYITTSVVVGVEVAGICAPEDAGLEQEGNNL